MSHIRTSHGASALDVSKEGAPPQGSEPDEIRPEGDIQVESQNIASAAAIPIPSEPPEVVIMPGPGGLPTIAEEPAHDREPEPPPSTMGSTAESEMRSNHEPASASSLSSPSLAPSAAPRRSWQSMSSDQRQSSLRELERLPECMRPAETASSIATRLESGERPTVRQRVEEFEHSQRSAEGTLMCLAGSDDEVFISNSEEVNWRKASPEEKRAFLEPGGSDESEWKGLLKTNPDAIRIHRGSDATALRNLWPDRIMPSRMVRRWKSQPGVNAPPKPKSRWCAQGFRDPDGGELHTYSPTPPVEVVMIFLQMVASLNFTVAVADVKQAFLQSDPLSR
eukprot:5326029-Amphidinium_carterae.1